MAKVVDHERRRVELAEAVLAVIERDGVNAASVRTVAAEAGWSRGVIAHYFTGRDDLMLYAYRLALQRETDLLPTARDEPDPLERLVKALSRLLPVDGRSAVDFQIWLGFMGRVADNPELGPAVLREHQELRRRIGVLVAECVEAGVLGAAVTAEALVIYVDGLGVAAALDPAAYQPHRLLELIRRQLSA